MVGYEKNDTITANQKLIAGCISGMLTRFVTQPLDVVKIRTQLLKKDGRTRKGTRWFPKTRGILREEGITALWKGHNLGQMHSVLSISSQFYVFELATKYAANFDVQETYQPCVSLACGVMAGCASTVLAVPLEVIRVRQMITTSQYKGTWNGAKMVYGSGGFLAFYEGLSASLMQTGPAAGISFAVFNYIQPKILGYFYHCKTEDCHHTSSTIHKPQYLVLATGIAGSIAGFVSKTLTYPFDLAKRRLQISSHRPDKRYATPSSMKQLVRCKNLGDCIIKTFKTEGLQGLYRGWKITMYKAQISSIITFTTYELVCYAMREYGGSL